MWSCGEHERIGRVVGCDYHFGITIINDDQNDVGHEYLSCWHGPMSRRIVEDGFYKDEQKWKEDFSKAINELMNERFDIAAIKGQPRLHGTNPTAELCAFGK